MPRKGSKGAIASTQEEHTINPLLYLEDRIRIARPAVNVEKNPPPPFRYDTGNSRHRK